MQMAIWIVGALVILEGVVFLIQPNLFKKLVSLFARGRMIYISALFRLILGPIFLIFARECKIPWIIIIFGILMLIGSAILFLVNIDKIKAILLWWTARSVWAIRSIAVIALLLGTIIVVAGLPQ
jgi:uncharacterized protein YjeT (DUF2065 family)